MRQACAWLLCACAVAVLVAWSSPSAADTPPAAPASLNVAGFDAAMHVGPDTSARPSGGPWPVVVVVHGVRSRAERACNRWAPVARWYGWILCIRGGLDTRSTRAQDLRTPHSRGKTLLEIDAALDALEARYPGKVRRDGMMYVGSSRGAQLAAGVILASPPGRYSYIGLVEGGVERLSRRRMRAFKQAGIRGILMAMSQPGFRAKAMASVATLKAEGIRGVFVDMKGAGHAYRDDFATTGLEGMRALIHAAPAEPSLDARTPR